MRFIISIFIIFSSSVTIAQNWAKVTNEKFSDAILCVMYDSIHNKLISSGRFTNKIGNLNIRGVASWNSIKWDSLAGGINTHNKIISPNNPNGTLSSGITYNNMFLTGGYFKSIGGISTTGLALWNGVKWDSLPKRGFRSGQEVVVTDFLIKGSILYIIGQFDTIAGQPTNGIATWDGTNFNPILLPIDPSFQAITSIVEYQNEIYITGGAFIGNVGDVLKYNGTSWVSTTGGGFLGLYAGARQLIVYDGELFAGGYFEKANGNAGNNLIKWDGNHWRDVGFGTIGSYIEINKMLVYHNKLWVFGNFPKVANSFAGNVAVYDGSTWCGLKDTLNNTVNTATVYNDTIYIGGAFSKANSDSIFYIAKLSDANLVSQCVNVGINELSNVRNFIVYPNPTSSNINIIDELNELNGSGIELKNSLGQTILSYTFQREIDVSFLANGIYFIQIKTSDHKLFNAKFIKQ